MKRDVEAKEKDQTVNIFCRLVSVNIFYTKRPIYGRLTILLLDFFSFQPLGSIGGVRDLGPGPEHDQYLWSSKVTPNYVRSFLKYHY